MGLLFVRIEKTPRGDGNYYSPPYISYTFVRIEKTPRGDGNLNPLFIPSNLFVVRIEKTPRGDGNPLLNI